MKKIFRIARLELSIMFYSPIAWLVLVIFIAQTGIIFTDLLYSQETKQQLGRPLSVLSKVLFAGEDGILAKIQENLYLYIPLLTMGLFSRETSSGSIKLLQSSPVTVPQMVLGKFLSIAIYGLLLSLVLFSFVLVGNHSIESLDIPFVLGGILGIYLLICTYASIGLFMSSLTSYQVVSAISTLAVLAFLSFIGNIGQSHDFVRDITYWLSISGRTDNLVNGLISSKDIVYFLLVMGMFLILTVLKLQDERKSKKKSLRIVRYILAIIVPMTIGYISSLPSINGYYDTTRFKDRTLTEYSQNIIDRLKAPLKITSYVNIVHYSASQGAPKNRIKDLNHFEKYRRFKPGLEMEYITYYDTLVKYNDTTTTLLEKAKKAASAHKFDFDDLLTPEEIKQKIDLIPENNRLVRFIEYKDKTTPLRMFDDMLSYPKESEITAALKRIIDKPSYIGFVQGHNERSIHKMEDGGYEIIINGTNTRGSLINQGFQPIDILLEKNRKIPDSLDAIVLAAPKQAYTVDEEKTLLDYVGRGGNLLIAAEPGTNGNLEGILSKLGISFQQGTLLQESEDYSLDLIQGVFTPEAQNHGFKFYSEAIVSFPTAMGIQIADSSDFRVTPIMITNKEVAWNRTEPFDLETQRIFFDSEVDHRVAMPLAVTLERQVKDKNQKIMVVGDADFLSNVEMARNNLNTVNSSFAIRIFRWLNDGKYPVNTSRPRAIDTVINISRSEIMALKVGYALILPLIVGAIGAGLLMIRKRK
ncbi:MAG: ABC transporter permease subunit [Algicola sp.]|nr:ABC transporter permease subunit [Algicola sp.]